MSEDDPRRRVPRTDRLLSSTPARQARDRVGDRIVRAAVHDIQDRVRRGVLDPAEAEVGLAESLRQVTNVSVRPVINATGVVVHTNLGRAPLSAAAVQALVTASGYVDVELDLVSGTRSRRGAATRAALLAACPAAEDALVVNNGAAALALACTALASGREIVVSRGELIEIGAGFRLPDLMTSTGAALREVGTTNRTHLDDYVRAVGERTGCLLKVHPSNFTVQGFTAAVSLADLHSLADRAGVPLVADLGSGLLAPDPVLPDEPDAATALAAGADLVIASGDKLLGGPQAGLLLGRAEIISRLARHPLARAVRADKLALAALEATLTAGDTPVTVALHADSDQLLARTRVLASALGADVVAHDGRVGGGGGPEVPLPGHAIRLPEAVAQALRTGDPAVLPRVHDGACLVDLRCVPPGEDDRLLAALRTAVAETSEPTNG